MNFHDLFGGSQDVSVRPQADPTCGSAPPTCSASQVSSATLLLLQLVWCSSTGGANFVSKGLQLVIPHYSDPLLANLPTGENLL